MEYVCKVEELISELIHAGELEIDCLDRTAAYSFAHGIMEGAGIDHPHWPWSNYKEGNFPVGLEFGKALKAARILGLAVKVRPIGLNRLPIVVVYMKIQYENETIVGAP